MRRTPAVPFAAPLLAMLALPACRFHRSPLDEQFPDLAELRLHNGTIWRWNRPCYGVTDGRAHLRIEMRAIPAGPTIADEVANAAFFLGLMASLPEEYGDIASRMAFDDVKENFIAAARQGVKAQFTWLRGESLPAATLVQEQLLPLARRGLEEMRIEPADKIGRAHV